MMRPPNPITVGPVKVTASRWPWQRQSQWAPANPRGARFGAGWQYSLGVDIGGRTVLLKLIWGIIRIKWDRRTSQ